MNDQIDRYVLRHHFVPVILLIFICLDSLLNLLMLTRAHIQTM